jgi:hypothetical protein
MSTHNISSTSSTCLSTKENLPHKLNDYVGVLEAFLEPKCFQETMDGPRWQEVMEHETSLI